MGDDVTPPGGRSRLRRVLIWTAGVLAVVLVAVGATVALAYRSLDDNLQSDPEVFADIVGDRPVMPTFEHGRPLNILVMGLDGEWGGDTAPTRGRSDSTMLIHIGRDRGRAYVVSVPRDLMVSRPQCRSLADPRDILPAASPVMWNEAYSYGGPSCAIAQFEQMTNIRVDHFVIVNYDSVTSVTDALDGVPICMDETLDIPTQSIYLPAGCYEVDGEDALHYVRVRLKIADQSDISRMKRQQMFVASMLDKATSLGTLSDPMRIYRFLDEVTQSFVTDPGLAYLGKLTDLGLELRDMGGENVALLSMPFTSYAPDPNRLAPASDAALLWDQLRRDEELDARFTEESVRAGGAGG